MEIAIEIGRQAIYFAVILAGVGYLTSLFFEAIDRIERPRRYRNRRR